MIVISNLAVFVGLIWTLAFFLQARDSQWSRAERHANVDGLTGLMNRRFFDSSIALEIKRNFGAASQSESFSADSLRCGLL